MISSHCHAINISSINYLINKKNIEEIKKHKNPSLTFDLNGI